MKVGDLVRVTRRHGDLVSYRLGLLIEHNVWEKIVTVLIEGKLERCRASDVTRAGRRDQELLGGTL